MKTEMFISDKPSAVIFDLDGTLVSSTLDFSLIRREIACPSDMDILDFVSSLNPASKNEAEEVIRQHELRDAESAQEIEGAGEALDSLRQQGISTAIVTRNSFNATKIKLSRTSIQVEHIITREKVRPKPAPDALLYLAKKWNYPCRNCLYVGDYKYDLEAAKNANMHALWFANNQASHPSYASMADLSFGHYRDFIARLDEYWSSLC